MTRKLHQEVPHPHSKASQRARVRPGALAVLEGLVVRMKNSRLFILTNDLFMQSFDVEVDGAEAEPVNLAFFNGSVGSH